MNEGSSESHLPGDPVDWVRELESVWQAMDAEKAILGYSDDAVMVYGADQRQDGEPLRQRPRLWFQHAADLQIQKRYVAHTNDCIVTTWNSTYTHPDTMEKMHERGIEFFRFRHGKIIEQHVWQHSWPEGRKPSDVSISV